MPLVKHIINILFYAIAFSILILSNVNKLLALEMNWIEVARNNNQIQFIDTNSIKYNNRGFLSVLSKLSDINTEDQNSVNSKSYLLAVDCDRRLFSKLPATGDVNDVKFWEESSNDILIKKTILNSCSY